MTTVATIESTLVDWVAQQLPTRIVQLSSRGEGPQPREPYCVILTRNYQKIGHQAARLSEDGTTESITNVTHIDVQIEFYYGQTKQDAAILRASLASSQRWLDLYTVCGLVNDGNLEDLTELETGAMRQRARFSFTISANLGWEFGADSFNTVGVLIERADLADPIVEVEINGDEPVCNI